MSFIYDWGTREDFLLRRLYPQLHVMSAEPLEDSERIVEATSDRPHHRNLCFLHLNVSDSRKWFRYRDGLFEELDARGYHVVNKRISDIRKSTVQRMNRSTGLPHVRVARSDEGTMKVIVKTDCNYGGVAESQLTDTMRAALGIPDGRDCAITDFDEYFVCRLCDLDDHVWQDDRLVVERYAEDKEHRLIRFYRCGSRAVLSELINPETIRKMMPGLPRKNWFFHYRNGGAVELAEGDGPMDSCLQESVENAARLCETIGLEFGALDIVLDESSCPHIVDVNSTPGWGKETQSAMLDFLRDGFEVKIPTA